MPRTANWIRVAGKAWFLSLLLISLPAFSGTVSSQHFPLTPRVKEQSRFWESVFQKYAHTSVLIHDARHPQLVLDIIDFKVFSDKFRKGRGYSQKDMDNVIRKYLDRYRLAINRVRKEQKKALRHGAMEKRVLDVYASDKEAFAELLQGKAVLRSQRGLADDFKKAVARAKNYLPYMEKTFRENGLPLDLTRIAFVESMFNVHAISKVGASGMWQFMPETAHHFLVLNPFIDERNSPFKATRAAAQLLKQNYELLKTWPLAVTAYNHGTAGVFRAIKQLKTRNMDIIIDRYRGPAFGFASRNYYGEFIAARNVYNAHYFHYEEKKPNPLNVAHVKLPRRLSVSQLLQVTPLGEDVLREYNKCLKKSAFSVHRDTPLPRDFVLTVPKNLAVQIEKAFSKLSYTAKTSNKGTTVWKR